MAHSFHATGYEVRKRKIESESYCVHTQKNNFV